MYFSTSIPNANGLLTNISFLILKSIAFTYFLFPDVKPYFFHYRIIYLLIRQYELGRINATEILHLSPKKILVTITLTQGNMSQGCVITKHLRYSRQLTT